MNILDFLNAALPWTLLFAAAVVVPFLSLREKRRDEARRAAGAPFDRMAHFASLIRWEWGIALALVVAWFALGRGAADAFLVGTSSPWEWATVGMGLVLAALAIGLSRRSEIDVDQLDALEGQLDEVEMMAARGPRERRRFLWLSLTAGVCEEIQYRGILLGALVPLMGVWPALIVATGVFGLGHAYQGPSGIVRTGAVGLVFGLLTVLSGSIWVAVVVHALLDVFQGRVLSAAAERADARAAGTLATA